MANVLEIVETVSLESLHRASDWQSVAGNNETCVERWNLDHPERVLKILQQWIRGGAEIVTTNSLFAKRSMLARWGLDDRVSEINWKAARLAREAAQGTEVKVAGGVGPVESGVEGLKELFRDSMGPLLDGGCDLIFLKGFGDLAQTLIAVDVFQNLTNDPLIVSLEVGHEGKMISGETIEQARKALLSAGVDRVI